MTLTPLAQKILDQRIPRDQQEEFLTIQGSNLPHHSWLTGYKEKVLSWLSKIQKGDEVLIFGDYDVDGLLSSYMAKLFMSTLGFKPVIFIPCRFSDGYGFSLQTLSKNNLLHHKHLLVLDSGTNEVERAQYFPANILVIDHHTPNTHKQSNMLVNPHVGCAKGTDFCTGSLMYMFNQIMSESNESFKKLLSLSMALSAVTTISDQCVLVKHNRTLVSMGLNLINLPLNQGLQMLLMTLCNDKQINETDLAWKVCPTMNAAGRLGKPKLVIDLLSTTDPTEANALCHELIELNDQRRELTAEAFGQASLQASSSNSNVLCVFSKSWHPGIVGIVAGNIASRFKKPCFAFTKGSSGLWEGSGRSYSNISLLNLAEQVKDKLSGYGGHAQAMGIKTANVIELQHALDQLPPLDSKNEDTKHTLTITASDVTPQSILGLSSLRPFGNGNEEPMFQLTGNIVRMSAAKTGMTGTIQDETGTVRFYCPEDLTTKLNESVLANNSITITGTLDYTPPYPPSMFIRMLQD